jgi:hypothetical protein
MRQLLLRDARSVEEAVVGGRDVSWVALGARERC